MTPDETTAAPHAETPAETPAEAPPMAAPPRAVPLVSRPGRPVTRRPTLPAVSSYSQVAPMPAREKRSTLEHKLAGLYDATEMMRVLDTEVALHRARRLHSSGSRQTLRVAAIALLVTLLVAALGAMSYLQSTLAERGFSRHRTDATASPTPGPSGPAAAPTARPAGAAR